MQRLNDISVKFAGANTTLGIIATNVSINREQANKLASIAHDGLALSIRPVHTSMDGDTIFALSTGEIESYQFSILLSVAAESHGTCR
jgi:L-aminopeptidase/D-esterase-like protein